MFNKVILVGRLTRDVELKYLPSGSSVASFGFATSRNWKDKNTSEMKEEVMFVDIDTFGRSAEIANQYLRKGSKILVEGRLVQDRWQDQQGQNRSKHKVLAESIKFMDTKAEAMDNEKTQQSDNSAPSSYGNNSTPPPQARPAAPKSTPIVKEESVPEIDINDDDIPF